LVDIYLASLDVVVIGIYLLLFYLIIFLFEK